MREPLSALLLLLLASCAGAPVLHDPNAIDAVRFTVAVPFAGAGRISAPRRRDAHFPWA